MIGRHFERVFAFLNQAAFNAVFDIGQFDTAVADGAAAVGVECAGSGADLLGHWNAVAQEETFVAAAVADDLDIRIELGIALDETTDGG